MKAFVIVALVAAVSGEADPYTIGQVLAGQTNGGVLTSTTYHGGVKVAGFPYTKVAAVPHTYTYGYPYAYYGKREAEAEPEPWTVGQIAAGAHVAEAIKDGRAHNVGVITNAAIAPIAATHVAYAGYPYAYYGKREAEADPALLYTSGLVGYPYAVGAHPANIWGTQLASSSLLQPLPLDHLRLRISSWVGFPCQGVTKHPYCHQEFSYCWVVVCHAQYCQAIFRSRGQ